MIIRLVKMDVARFLIRTKCCSLINETLSVRICGLVVKLKVVEDTQGPLRVCATNKYAKDIGSVSSGEDSDDHGDCDMLKADEAEVSEAQSKKDGKKVVECFEEKLGCNDGLLSNINGDGTCCMYLEGSTSGISWRESLLCFF